MNSGPQQRRTMRDAFLERVYERMRREDDIFFLSADFGAPVLDKVRAEFPDRFVNVGIAEQNLVNVATGLSLEGYRVFAYALAPFITMRAYEQSRVNLAILSQIKGVSVNLVGVGAGLSYDVSGPTHHCVEDLAIMRTLPGVQVLSPADWVQAGAMADYCLDVRKPKYLRFDGKPHEAIYGEDHRPAFETGFTELRRGRNVCIVSTGFMTHRAIGAAYLINIKPVTAGVIDVFMLKPVDEAALASALERYDLVITAEEGLVERGGLDSLVTSALEKAGLRKGIIRLGFRDAYTFELGGRDHLHRLFGLDDRGIADSAFKALASEFGLPL